MGQAQKAYELKKLPDTFKTPQKLYSVNKKTGKLESKDGELKGGYMAFFPQGHSVRLTEEEALRLQLGENPDLVDLEEGVVLRGQHLQGNAMSLESLVAARTQPTRGQVMSEQLSNLEGE